MKVGLFFGTFNPIHVGHLIIANHMADFTDLDQIWLVVTPQNPLKDKQTLLADHHRLAMVREAIEDNPKLKASDFEFKLPKPSYTIDTLTYLKEEYPKYEFSLLMGEDNIRTFRKWKNHEEVLKNHNIFVYPRAITESEDRVTKSELLLLPTVHLCETPVLNISASFIRKSIKEKKDVRYLLTEPVYKYCKEMHFYEK